MAGFLVSRLQRPLLGILTLGLVVGCGAAPQVSGDQTAEILAPPDAVAPEAAAPETTTSAEGEASNAAAQLTDVNTVPQQPPRLVKRASLVIQVNDLTAAIAAVEDLLAQQQGDLLRLEDTGYTTAAHQVMLEMRVPQGQLTTVLERLKGLGQVQQQSLTAEDVSSQLVDLEARVRNLRQSEAALLVIMERSGSIAEVLEVSRELSTVREAIERTEAQRQNLQGQVAFSTITLTLQTVGAAAPETPPVVDTLGRTWQAATHSVATVSIALVRLSLWLLAYSPYWAVMVLLALGYRRWQRRQGHPSAPTEIES